MRLRGEGRRRTRRRRSLLFVLLVTVVLLDSATLAGAAVLHARRIEQATGANAVIAPEVSAVERPPSFTTDIEYAALFSGDGHQVSSQVTWDDEWFFQDPTVYNAELAHTCAVLSAVANAESAYYQQGSSVPAFAENAFASLGFDEVSTASYRYRSEVLDELRGLLDGTDVVAYTLATKRLRSRETGAEKELCVVVVRGSYGSEWLSNIRIEGTSDVARELGDADHLGFTLAAAEIVLDLEGRADAVDPGVERSYLFCGHSRGGAVANLLASYADGASGAHGAIPSAGDVRAYTFATPNCTSADDARDATYDNVFNVLNPSDLVPRLSLAEWGYRRYGQDVWLPAEGQAAFDRSYDAMRDSYERSMGTECPYDPSDRETVDGMLGELGSEVSSFDELTSPAGLLTLTRLCLGVDAGRLLASHYPNTYIAWLDVVDASALTFM